jgi:hypothetical protein
MAEFDWWLLIVGVIAGGALVALVLTDSTRRDDEISERETEAEATWLATRLADDGIDLDPGTIEAVLRAHRGYLRLAPPDDLAEAARADPPRTDTSAGRTAADEPA